MGLNVYVFHTIYFMPHWCLGLRVVLNLACNLFLYKSNHEFIFVFGHGLLGKTVKSSFVRANGRISWCVTVCHKWGYEVDNVTKFHSSAFPSFYTVITCMKISLCSLSWNSCIITCIIIVLSVLPLWFCLAHRNALSLWFARIQKHIVGRCIAALIEQLTVPLLSCRNGVCERPCWEKVAHTPCLCASDECLCESLCSGVKRTWKERHEDVNFTHFIFMETMRMWRPSRYN